MNISSSSSCHHHHHHRIGVRCGSGKVVTYTGGALGRASACRNRASTCHAVHSLDDVYFQRLEESLSAVADREKVDGYSRMKSPHSDTTTDIPRSATLVDVLPYLVRLALHDASLVWRIGFATLAMVVSKAAGLLAPLYFKHAVDLISSPGDVAHGGWIPTVSMALVLHGLCRAVNALAKEAQHPLFTPVSQAAGRRISFSALYHVLGLDVHFHLGRNTGSLARMLERGSRSISMIFRAVVFTLAPTILELGAVCALLWTSFQWKVSSIVLATFAVYFAWTVWMTVLSTTIRRDVKNLDNVIGGRAVDALLNVEAVKLSGAELYEVEAYDEKLEQYQKASVNLEVASAVLNSGQALVLAVGMTAALIVAAADARVTTGDLVMIQGLLIQLWAPLQFLGWFYRELRQSLVDMEDLFTLMRTDTEVPDGTLELSEQDSDASPLRIQLENVEFKYPGTKRRVLKGVSITAEPGESIAIVGPSGSGKSTLLRIIVRMFDVQKGSVTIGGYNVKDLRGASVRSAVAVVPQDTVLFNDTMLHNVSYGNPDASAEEIFKAVKAAKLLPALDRMSEGWNTEVGERGLKLSGGEKQRVAIARAFLKKPRLLICDEATSALDTATEKGIMASLEELAANRTSVFVAHRLSTIQGCDTIFVLKDGLVAEQGTHASLMDSKGLYYDMWNMQATEDALVGSKDAASGSSSSEEDDEIGVSPHRVNDVDNEERETNDTLESNVFT